MNEIEEIIQDVQKMLQIQVLKTISDIAQVIVQ